jgi:probable F420-dependent oxidoreductase
VRSSPAIGLFSVNAYAAAGRDGMARVGRLAEELGYDSLWAGEHVVVPDPRRPPSPMEPGDPIADPLVALGFLAAHTERVRLGTGVIILPQRNPLVLAKQLASLDVVAGGRLTFGMGVGYVEPEMAAIGVSMEGRGRRADEYLDAMRALWEDERPSFEGEFVRFAGVDAHPRPLQRPLPVVVGGHSAAAHRRAAGRADGWYGFWLDVDQTAGQLDGVREALTAAGRDGSGFELSVTPAKLLTPETVRAYAELGVDRLVIMPPPRLALDELEAWVRAYAPGELGLTPKG